MNIDGIIISKHAYERYAERIMNRENVRDINIFIQKNSEKIETDIKDMIRYGAEIYRGRPHNGNTKQNDCIYMLNGLWIVIIDMHDLKVITLYKIDLGAGKDIDEAFRDSLVAKIAAAKEEVNEEIININNETSTYQQIIDDNNLLINEYKQNIKNLESINEAYSSTIIAANKRKAIAEDKVRSLVSSLVSKTGF